MKFYNPIDFIDRHYLLTFSEKWFGTLDLNILDWGCGKCQIAYFCKKRNVDILCCDINEERGDSTFYMQTPIEEYLKMNVIPLNHAYKLPFEDESIDVLLSFRVLEHVSNDQESLKEINRVLKKNGLFFCFHLPYTFSYKNRLRHLRGDHYHDRLYCIKSLKLLLETTKLKLIDIWLRDLLPKRTFVKHDFLKTAYPRFEQIDNWLCRNTLIKYLATNIEFVACKES